MKIIGNHAGQFGDLIIDCVLARQIKTQFPDSHYTFCFTKKYAEISRLFEYHPYIDDVHFWDAYYEDWPTKKDEEFLGQKYDVVLNPFVKHTSHNWWDLGYHQCTESCISYGLNAPESNQIYLNKWFLTPKFEKTITFSVFGGDGSFAKMFNLAKLRQLVEILNDMGYKCLQLGGKNEPDVPNLIKTNTSYFESVKIMLGATCHLSVDTSMLWVASGYEHPVLGLSSAPDDLILSNEPRYFKAIQPINKNALYIGKRKLHDITIGEILEGLKNIIR